MPEYAGNQSNTLRGMLVDLSKALGDEISGKLISAVFRLDARNWNRLVQLTRELGAESPAQAIIFVMIDYLKMNKMRKNGYTIVAQKRNDEREVELHSLSGS
jgi:hypothetical protein